MVLPLFSLLALSLFQTGHAYQFATVSRNSSIRMTARSRNSSPICQRDRRSFVALAGGVLSSAFLGKIDSQQATAYAAPTIYTTSRGVKYAITKDLEKGAKKSAPQTGDIVAIEYTGYLTSGQIFDATHAEGKKNALLFKLGNVGAVIPGLDDVVSNMYVGQRVQAIIPPDLAFGSKGICLDEKPDECLIKPGSTLVYDVYLKKTTIPPP